MIRRMRGSWLVLGMVLALAGGPAVGQTIIIEPGPVLPPRRHPRPRPRPRPRPIARDVLLAVKKHTVEVSIVDGVAVTSIDQVFFNGHDRVVEGTYIFPLEDGVGLSAFSMYVGGERVEGKLLPVEEARRQYESIVARMRDPALLEYLGTRMFRARIFPIQPKSEVRVRLSYTQMLEASDGLVRYRYPLGTDRSLPAPIETVSVLVKVESKVPLKSVFSPSHKLAVSRPGEHNAVASFEGKNIVPDKNFELYYTLSDKEFGLTVLTHRPPGEDGFFLVRIAPPASVNKADVLPKDIAFVIDTSGSMAGEKIEQARKALRFCLANLNPKDRFSIIPFSHEATTFRDTLVTATKENVAAAREFATGLIASGGTNINDALVTAVTGPGHLETDRPYLIVFLTDGLPTIGVTDVDEILQNVRRGRDGRVRLFVFGVGYDVNTRLLDLLAEQNRGTREYIEPDENLELRLSSFYRKVAEPVLANLDLSFKELKVYDLFPPKLGDLFAGSELVVTGRYTGDGAKAVELTGTRRGQRERFVDETAFPAKTKEHDFLPRLWATRKVGFLLDQIRLHGGDKRSGRAAENDELKQAVIKLATKYGIVTPYTAYLVTEPGGVAHGLRRENSAFAKAVRSSVASDARVERVLAGAESAMALLPAGRQAQAQRSPAAKAARVQASQAMAKLRFAGPVSAAARISSLRSEDEAVSDGRDAMVERVGPRTFYRVGERWVDAGYDGEAATTKVEAFSVEYFELIRRHGELAKCFALGERVVVLVGETTYETVPPPEK